MFTRSSTILHSGFLLLTLGHTCRYLIAGEEGVVIVDPGHSFHTPLLSKRLAEFNLSFNDITAVCITHPHADRIMALPHLKLANPKIKFHTSTPIAKKLQKPACFQQLKDDDLIASKQFQDISVSTLSDAELKKLLTPDHIITESDVISVHSELRIKLLSSPGHTEESVSYLVEPYQYLIVDEGFGYYRGKEFVAPGGDYNLETAAKSASKWHDSDIGGLALPYGGVITGALVNRHLVDVVRNTADMVSECKLAFKDGVPDDEIKQQVFENFYTTESGDPVLQASLTRSFESAWNQIRIAK